MCELFTLSSLYPATVSFSLEEFADHGGRFGPHKDGWGVVYYEHNDIRIMREAAPASSSPCIEMLKSHGFRSNIVISHIRLASEGELVLRNTQPFSRSLGGRMHVFAHNGELPAIREQLTPAEPRLAPIGETDSEYAFCVLMQQLDALWSSSQPPSLMQRYRVIADFAEQIRPLGPANFIYSDGEYIFAHGDKRTQPGQEGFHPPGLYWLQRNCQLNGNSTPISGVNIQAGECEQQVVLIASVPLTTENWIPFQEGELLVVGNGTILHPEN
jgi:predicted glutamine amidotransferase